MSCNWRLQEWERRDRCMHFDLLCFTHIQADMQAKEPRRMNRQTDRRQCTSRLSHQSNAAMSIAIRRVFECVPLQAEAAHTHILDWQTGRQTGELPGRPAGGLQWSRASEQSNEHTHSQSSAKLTDTQTHSHRISSTRAHNSQRQEPSERARIADYPCVCVWCERREQASKQESEPERESSKAKAQIKAAAVALSPSRTKWSE